MRSRGTVKHAAQKSDDRLLSWRHDSLMQTQLATSATTLPLRYEDPLRVAFQTIEKNAKREIEVIDRLLNEATAAEREILAAASSIQNGFANIAKTMADALARAERIVANQLAR
jgi:hypothetical protein